MQGVTGQSILGATGQRGITGLQGSQGDTGIIGETGPQGLQGNTGVIGDTGVNGAQGPQGDTGVIGETGTQGSQGQTGLQGPPYGQEVSFELSSGASLAARTFIGGYLPSGCIIADGTGTRVHPAGLAISVDSQLGSSANDLILDFSALTTMVLVKHDLVQVTGTGEIGIISTGSVTPKTNSSRTQARIQNFQTDIGAANGAVTFLKLV
jgi:hypothetical protein